MVNELPATKNELEILTDLIEDLQNQLQLHLNTLDTKSAIFEKLKNSTCLNQDTVKQHIFHLNTYNKLIQELISNSPNSAQQHFHAFLSKNKWKAPDNLWDVIPPDSVLEVYDSMGLQIYRCINFFKYSGYSFADLISNHWWDLYDRNLFIQKKLGDYAVRMFQENITSIKPLEVPIHKMSEKWSALLGEGLLSYSVVIPIADKNGSVTALLAPVKMVEFKFTRSID